MVHGVVMLTIVWLHGLWVASSSQYLIGSSWKHIMGDERNKDIITF